MGSMVAKMLVRGSNRLVTKTGYLIFNRLIKFDRKDTELDPSLTDERMLSTVV